MDSYLKKDPLTKTMTKIKYRNNQDNHYKEDNLQPALQKSLMPETNHHESDRPRINDEIKCYNVRVIDNNGNNIGVITPREALQRAKQLGLDLVEVSPSAKPPVCKIMDFGKFLFEKRKKQKESFQKAPETHEIRLTPCIGVHDIEIKAKKALEFLTEGSKVILQFKLRGRETKHPELIKEVINKFYDFVKEKAVLESKGGSYTLVPKI